MVNVMLSELLPTTLLQDILGTLDGYLITHIRRGHIGPEESIGTKGRRGHKLLTVPLLPDILGTPDGYKMTPSEEEISDQKKMSEPKADEDGPILGRVRKTVTFKDHLWWCGDNSTAEVGDFQFRTYSSMCGTMSSNRNRRGGARLTAVPPTGHPRHPEGYQITHHRVGDNGQ
ncbi:hypothetical protein CEXT_145791 [Caerostris extrusa]|uniref:Uncharacterized protein n=1 Tax=Caerostris extrusa TaxID=172846 RepID=A0AAV4W9L2_CAEEX|nr:hypothetical protein CEXT_145791 [Caerostris extrusa]